MSNKPPQQKATTTPSYEVIVDQVAERVLEMLREDSKRERERIGKRDRIRKKGR
ncbi:MAG: hypothetical protein AAFV33_01000 [Chloroflexota bacterium]